MRRRARDERGQASVELMLMLPLMLLVGLVLWQVHLTLTVANDAENAARTASRDGGGADAARQALAPTDDEVAWARRVLAAAADGGVTTLDGAMVDAPVVSRARALLSS